MNPISSNANSAQAAAPTAGSAVVAKSAGTAAGNTFFGQEQDAAASQPEKTFGDVLGQVRNLIAELSPTNTPQTAPASSVSSSAFLSQRPEEPQSIAVTAESPAGDVEDSLPAFMPVASMAQGKRASRTQDSDVQDAKIDGGVSAQASLPLALMPGVVVPVATPGRAAQGQSETSAGTAVIDTQCKDMPQAIDTAKPGAALTADIQAMNASGTRANLHAEDSLLIQGGDQSAQNASSGVAAGQPVAQLPNGNPPVAGDSLRLPNGDPTQWRQTLADALGERVVLQREKGTDQATIRLDPPAMGQIEISIRHEAGALKVSIAATHTEVLNQLRGVGEALRQDLEQKHWGEVTVQVSQSGARLSGDDGRGGSGGGREQARRDPGRALTDENGEATAGFHLESGEA